MRKQRFNIFIIVAVFALLIALTGCDNFLDGYSPRVVTAHTPPPFVREEIEVEAIVATNYDELVQVILELIKDFSDDAFIRYHHEEGEDGSAEIQQALYEAQNYHPIGVYILENINVTEKTEATLYTEFSIEIEYARTPEQVESIIPVATGRYLRTQVLNSMSKYAEEILIRTGLGLTEEDIMELVREIYYSTPGGVLALPVVAVRFFPEEGDDRIYEITLRQRDDSSIMLRYGEQLSARIHAIAGSIEGDTDSEVLLALIEFLIDAAEFDLSLARTIGAHGTQQYEATAFGALNRRSAVGEGFAMAFKALLDEMGFDNRIILGYLDGMLHAWNIVLLDGHFYHIDVALSSIGEDEEESEDGFIRFGTDEDFREMLYDWDVESVPASDGPLTIDDLRPEDPCCDECEDEDEEGEYNEEEDDNDE